MEVESDNLDFIFFYTLFESPSQPIFTKLESCMNEDCGKKRSKILLDVHETIIAQIMITRCACKCLSKTTRKSLENTLCTQNAFY